MRPVHTKWVISDDAGRVVAVDMDIADAVARLLVRPEGSLGQIECYIQEVDFTLVCLRPRDLQAVLLKDALDLLHSTPQVRSA